jgi:hypothetical protein
VKKKVLLTEPPTLTSCSLHQFPAVGGGQCHTLTYLLSFCQKVSSDGKTELCFCIAQHNLKEEEVTKETKKKERRKPKKNKTGKEERHDTEDFKSMNLRKIEAIEVKINLGEF